MSEQPRNLAADLKASLQEHQAGKEVDKISVAPMIRQYGDEFGKVLPRHIGTERYERCLKTLVHQLRKWVPWSTEIQAPRTGAEADTDD